MRSSIVASALTLCGVVACVPVALANPASAQPSSPARSSTASLPAHPAVGAGKLTLTPSTARTGRTIRVTGAAAPYPGARYVSVQTKAGVVHITSTRAQHVRGFLRINAGPGNYLVVMKFSNGNAVARLHVVGCHAPSGRPVPAKSAPQHRRTATKDAPRPAPRTSGGPHR
jgi:hypothetical protein